MSLRLGFGIGIPMGNPEEFYIVSQKNPSDEFVTAESNGDLMITEVSP